MAVLLGFFLVLCYVVYQYGGMLEAPWALTAVGVGALTLAAYRRRPGDARRPSTPLLCLTLAVPLFVLGQLVPLPSALAHWLSPALGKIDQALEAGGLATGSWRPLAVAPGATAQHLWRVVIYSAAALTAWRLAHRRGVRSWALVAPVVAVGVVQAMIGIAQMMGGEAFARGAYMNRNHFAGLLEMAAPPALAFALAMSGEAQQAVRRKLFAAVGWLAAALMLGGILLSLSRAGFLVALLGIAQLFALRAWSRGRFGRRHHLAPALGGATVLICVFLAAALLPSDGLAARFSDLDSDLSMRARPELWHETTGLIGEYPLTGCGLGCFSHAVGSHREFHPLRDAFYAHNDYLQATAELGAPGAMLLIAPLALIVIGLVRRVRRETDSHRRHLALGCCVSIVSIGLHSLVDFNLYIPANALTFAWIVGIAAALASRRRRPSLESSTPA